jgi:N-methylhydantoinase A
MRYEREGSPAAPGMGPKVGIEIGGTFTDLILIDGAGELHIEKVLTTPDDLTDGAIEGFERIVRATDGAKRKISELLHGSTVATNALIERKGAGVGVIATSGFEDVLIIGRQEREDVNDMFYRRQVPLVRRRDIVGVHERLSVSGDVLQRLDEAHALEVIRHLVKELGHRSLAVCLLHSYRNALHERRLAALIAEHHPGIEVSLSSDVCPEHREYERASTTVISAYVQPVVARYLGRLSRRIEQCGFPGTPLIMQSNGGVLPVEAAAAHPAQMYVSGPAAGVTGAAYIARSCAAPNLITMDVGGTSCDLSLITEGQPHVTQRGLSEFRVHGQPLNLVMMDIVALGAGGGSIAHRDLGGMLQVGPTSAGAMPGPACYGRGGEDFTLTDALLLLGLLDPDDFAGGSIALDVEAAQRVARPLGQLFALDEMALASSVQRIAVANIAQGIRLSTVQRGRDPRDYALCPYGGVGPLLAAQVAEELSISRVVVPPVPGVFSAFGLCVADMRMDFVRSLPGTVVSEETVPSIAGAFASLIEEAGDAFARIDDSPEAQLELALSADARYDGQGYELRIPIEQSDLESHGHDRIRETFHAAHEQQYGHRFPVRGVELVNLRIVAVRRRPTSLRMAQKPSGDGIGRCRNVRLGSGEQAWPVLDRGGLTAEWVGQGPLLVMEETSATVVPPGWQASVGPSLTLDLRHIKS